MKDKQQFFYTVCLLVLYSYIISRFSRLRKYHEIKTREMYYPYKKFKSQEKNE